MMNRFSLFLFLLPPLFAQAQTQQKIPYGANPAAGQTIVVNGIPMYCEIYGTGQPLLLLNGNGGSIRSRFREIPVFAEKYKVIAVDSRCHGKSGCMAGDLNYEMMTADIAALLNRLNIDSCLIWGQSDGGIMALILGYQYPKKVKKMVITGANLVPDSSAIFPDLIRIVNQYASLPDTMQQKHTKLLAKHPNIPFERLAGISAPVLVMAGDRDAIREEHTVRIFQSLPNGQLCIVPGATHFLVAEKPALFHSLVADFFEKPFSKPSTVELFKQMEAMQKAQQAKGKQ